METNGSRKIEIFAPFSSALDLTKLILFQPFDLAKWMIIGFAAFLAHFNGGGGGFNFNRRWTGCDWKAQMHSTTRGVFDNTESMPVWFWPVFLFAMLFVFALVVLFMWIGARGKFIFTDCIVRNRAAIVEPWKEFRAEGNSYFLYSLLIFFLCGFLVALASMPLWLPLALGHGFPEGVPLFFGLGLIAMAIVALGVTVSLLSVFVVPVMYRRRCGAGEALRFALSAITSHPVPVILYFLLSIVLAIALVLIGCLAACVTCCIAAIPYVGTVLLLPLHVFLASFALLFARQFGDDYDAWAKVLAVEPVVALPDPPPPLQA